MSCAPSPSRTSAMLDLLDNVSLVIYPGQKVAVAGRTGSGKSTLAKLLLGLYAPTEGEILYDGVPLRAMNFQSVRSRASGTLPVQFLATRQHLVSQSGNVLERDRGGREDRGNPR